MGVCGRCDGLAHLSCEADLPEWVVEPVHEFRRTIGKVAHALHYRAPFASSPGLQDRDRITVVSGEFRKLASDLRESLVVIPLYGLTAFCFRLPSRKNVLDAVTDLIGLSNTLHESARGEGMQNAKRAERICRALGIKIPDGE